MSRIQGKTISNGSRVYAGIDVSKASLDLHALLPDGGCLSRRFANDDAGIGALTASLGAAPCRVVFEPTGRFHLGLWQALDAAGHEPVPWNPFRARCFAEVEGKMAKTDAIDARVLARAAACLDLAPAAPPAGDRLRIKELHGVRLGLVRALRTAKNRHGAACDALARRLLGEQVAFIEAQLAEIGAELARLIDADPALARRRDILASIPGLDRRPDRRAARTRHRLRQEDRGAARRRADEPRQRHLERPAPHQGRTLPPARRPSHGGAGRGAMQPRPQDLPQPSCKGRKTSESRPDRRAAKARNPRKRPHPR